MYSKITIKDKEYLKLELIPINQKGERWFFTKIDVQSLLKIYTVEPAEYDYDNEIKQASLYPDDNSYYHSRLKHIDEIKTSNAFQRKESKTRVKEISDFLKNDKHPFFPNSVIVTCSLFNNSLDFHPQKTFEDTMHGISDWGNYSFLEETSNSFFLYVPIIENSLLIIDGQHRVKGLEKALENGKMNYEILLSFIIDYDRSVVAKQFYTINYNQKSVNKSLLYHLSSEFSNELDEVTFLHQLVRLFSSLENSPFKNRIKMLGTAPSNIDNDKKALMTISQAFLIDNLIKTISLNSINSIYAPIFLYYFNNEKSQIEIIRFILRYFTAISNLLPEQWNDPSSIICKTVGIGAFIKILHFIYIKLFIDSFKMDPKEMYKVSVGEFKKILSGIEKVDFSNTGHFAGAASASSLHKVKEMLVENIPFFEEDNYENFILNFKKQYTEKFKDWLIKNNE